LSNIDNMGATGDLNILYFELHSLANAFLGCLQGMPDLLELDHLTVFHDISLGRNVRLKSTVPFHHCEPRGTCRHSARID
ncbi:hypothetical protein PFISCL1PPCAC_17462, partial [Pristionchus fissidentatus]